MLICRHTILRKQGPNVTFWRFLLTSKIHILTHGFFAPPLTEERHWSVRIQSQVSMDNRCWLTISLLVLALPTLTFFGLDVYQIYLLGGNYSFLPGKTWCQVWDISHLLNPLISRSYLLNSLYSSTLFDMVRYIRVSINLNGQHAFLKWGFTPKWTCGYAYV